MSLKPESVLVIRDDKERIVGIIERKGLDYAIYTTSTASTDDVELLFNKSDI